MRELPPHPVALLFAKLPERLDDEQRRNKYDEPLARMVRDERIGEVLRGFSHRNDAGEIEWVGFELELVVLQNCSFVAARLLNLGAPLDTLLEVETEKATAEFTLAEATGR